MSARAGYELSKLHGEEARREAANAGGGGVTHEQAAEAVRRQSGPAKPRGTRQRFQLEDGWRVTVSRGRSGTLGGVAEALRRALEEVELRLGERRRLTGGFNSPASIPGRRLRTASGIHQRADRGPDRLRERVPSGRHRRQPRVSRRQFGPIDAARLQRICSARLPG